MDAALLYTSFADSGIVFNSGTYSRLVPQLDAEVGLSWRSTDAPRFSFAVGGRIATSFNTTITPDGSQGTLLEVGPFVRMAYNLSGPTRASLAQEPAALAPTAPGANSYLVFFDFDRTDLSPVADGVIRRAADDARAGRVATLQIASHADRAGSEEYNKALSLRRAEAIKDTVKRLGLSPDQIRSVQITF